MTIKLNDAQLMMLSKAAQREDRCVTPPAGLRGATLAAVGAKLLSANLVKETKARASMPIWNRDAATGAAMALKLTAAGLKAIAVDEIEDADDAATIVKPHAEVDVASSPAKRRKARKAETSPVRPKDDPPSSVEEIKNSIGTSASPTADVTNSTSPSAERAPRLGSKLATVMSLLARPDGATLPELVETTGWLSHTTRAALTGLRKRGYMVELDRSGRDGCSIYRLGTVLDRAKGSVAASNAMAS